MMDGSFRIRKDEVRMIKNINGKYGVGKKGNTYRLYPQSEKSPLKLKPQLLRSGLLQVGLYINGQTKYYLVHRLVAEAWLPNPKEKELVSHKDGNISKSNCSFPSS